MQSHRELGSLDKLVIRDAICLPLASAIDALSRLPEDVRGHLFGDTWPAIRATRNRIAHAYSKVNPAIIAATLENEIPPLLAVLRKAVDGEDAMPK